LLNHAGHDLLDTITPLTLSAILLNSPCPARCNIRVTDSGAEAVTLGGAADRSPLGAPRESRTIMSAWSNPLPDGVRYAGSTEDGFKLSLSMPQDENGLMMLACPREQDHRFAVRIKFEGPDADEIHCPYCGHRDYANEFLTDDAKRRLQEAAQAATILFVQQQFAGSGFRFEPSPMPQTIFTYEQEKTRRTMHCDRCNEPVAVFGMAMFCPGCGRNAPAAEFAEMLEVERRTISALTALPTDMRADMEAGGSLGRILDDSVKNTGGALEVFLKAVFYERVPNAETVLKAAKMQGNVFQRLGDVETLYRNHLAIDLPVVLGADWSTLLESMAARHVLVHTSGIVDQKYLDRVPGSALRIGQRITVSTTQVDSLLDAASALGAILADPNCRTLTSHRLRAADQER
jgi:uncharacterized Zn finger protein (UPF0148 family)